MSNTKLNGPAEAARRFVETAQLHMHMLDLEGRIIAISPPFHASFVREYGFTRDQVLGVRALDLDVDGRWRVKESMARLAAGEPRVEVEWKAPPVESRRRTIRTQSSYCCDLKGQPVAIVFVHTDVTAEFEAQAARRRSEALLRAVVENMPAELVLLNLDKRVIELINLRLVEAGWSTNVGVSMGAVGASFDQFLSPEYSARLEDAVARAEASGGVVDFEHAVDNDGDIRHVRIRHLLFRDESGDRQLLRIGEDVTELRRSSEALKKAAVDAEAANRAKSEFLANMSHEIRTPLNGVMGVAGALAHTELSAPQKEMVAIIESSAKTLETLLSDILDLARIEAGKMHLRPEPFDLASSVNACGALFDAAAQAKGLDFSVTIDPPALGVYVGDAPRIRQILSNLLGNAIKFTKAGAVTLQVSARAGETASNLRFEVRDTGIGFDGETKARLFSRFEQADGSITRGFGGSGLGLAISRSLTEAMGGLLEADAEPGRGAVFSLTIDLPRCEAGLQAALNDDAARNPATDPLAGLRVLLAEDHPTNRRVVELILGAAGVDLTCVENGAEAVEACRRSRFDLILMDMQMPVMDGLVATAEIRKQEAAADRARTPIHMLSANAMPEHVGASLAAGADGHLSKPIMADALIARVAEVALRVPSGRKAASTSIR